MLGPVTYGSLRFRSFPPAEPFWWTGTKTPFGISDKPISQQEVPWGYVEDFQREIHLRGPRKYWYPVALSDELKPNEPLAVKLLGDNIALFRNEGGTANALETGARIEARFCRWDEPMSGKSGRLPAVITV